MVTKDLIGEQIYLLQIMKLKYFKGEIEFEQLLDSAKVVQKLIKEQEKEIFGRKTLRVYPSEIKDLLNLM